MPRIACLAVALLALASVCSALPGPSIPPACSDAKVVPVCDELWTQGWLEETHTATCFSLDFSDPDIKNDQLRVWLEVTGSGSSNTPRLCSGVYAQRPGNWSGEPICSGVSSKEINECYRVARVDTDELLVNVFCEDDECKNTKVEYKVRFDWVDAKDSCTEGESEESEKDPTDSGSLLYGSLAVGIVLVVFFCLGILIGLRCVRQRRLVRRHAYGY